MTQKLTSIGRALSIPLWRSTLSYRQEEKNKKRTQENENKRGENMQKDLHTLKNRNLLSIQSTAISYFLKNNEKHL